MCMNCGCGEPTENHGNQANIVADDLRSAAAANGQDIGTTVRNLQASLSEMGDAGLASSRAGGGSIESSGMGRPSGGREAQRS